MLGFRSFCYRRTLGPTPKRFGLGGFLGFMAEGLRAEARKLRLWSWKTGSIVLQVEGLGLRRKVNISA